MKLVFGIAMLKKLVVGIGAVTTTAVGAGLVLLPPVLDKQLNRVHKHKFNPSRHAQELHKTLCVVDLHADSLLWKRDLSVRNKRGHIDVPRLIEGNVGLQAFTIVTKVPFGVNIEKNVGKSDLIAVLSVAEVWPIPAWYSLKQRVLYQAGRLTKLADESNGKFTLIKSARDLDEYLLKRTSDPQRTAGFLGIEGAHALDGDLANIDVFYDAGIRLMAPTHFFDNDIGGSAHGWEKMGLTEKGKQMIKLVQAKSMIVDLAHASSTTIDDVLSITTKPVIVSHTGVKGTCNNNRNITDEQIKKIAKTGGVIGIGYWQKAICGTDAQSIARAIRHTADVAGVEHVALGSDFDGAVAAPFDSSELVLLTDALITEGFSDDQIRLIMGANAMRVIKQCLPPT